MRPTPSETIAGIRKILKEVVEPEVHSEHALSRLREIRAVLAQTDWDDAALHLRRRTEATRALLADVRAWIEADPERRTALADVHARLAAERSSVADTFAELNTEHSTAAGHLVEAGRVLAERSPTDEAARDLRLRVLQQLAT